MFHYLVRKFLRALVNIDIVLVLCILASLFFAKAIFISAFLILVVCLFPTGQWMCTFLENRFPRLTELPADAEGIIVLGSGIDLETTYKRRQVCYNPALGRLIEFVQLAKKHPQLKLVFTGGGAFLKQGVNESKIVEQLFRDCGLDTNRILFERESRDTHENARFSYELVKPAPKQKWILVTSAMHMPRSVGLFRNLGWNVIPYPVDYHTTGKIQILNISLLNALHYWWYGAHELGEMLLNYLFGYSQEWIPRE